MFHTSVYCHETFIPYKWSVSLSWPCLPLMDHLKCKTLYSSGLQYALLGIKCAHSFDMLCFYSVVLLISTDSMSLTTELLHWHWGNHCPDGNEKAWRVLVESKDTNIQITRNHTMCTNQGSVWVWTQSMRDDVTLQRRLSLVGYIPRMISAIHGKVYCIHCALRYFVFWLKPILMKRIHRWQNVLCLSTQVNLKKRRWHLRFATMTILVHCLSSNQYGCLLMAWCFFCPRASAATNLTISWLVMWSVYTLQRYGYLTQSPLYMVVMACTRRFRDYIRQIKPLNKKVCPLT